MLFQGSTIFAPDYASQIMAFLSELPVTIFLPSDEKLTLLILSEWPKKDSPIKIPLFESQIIAKLSLLPVTNRVPS